VHQGTQQLVYGANNWSATVVGTTPPYLDARAWTIVSGYPLAIRTCARQRGWR
jgi:putative ABC transport system permease protein